MMGADGQEDGPFLETGFRASAAGRSGEAARAKIVDLLELRPEKLGPAGGAVRDREDPDRGTEEAKGPPDGDGDAADATDDAVEILADCLSERLARQERRDRARRWLARGAAAAVAFAVGWSGHAFYADEMANHQGGAITVAQGVAGTGGAIPRFLADAAGAHALFALDPVRPVEYTAEAEAAMRRWFARHFGAPVAVPHIEEDGYRLLGGRLLGTAEEPIAQIVYESARGDRVSLFVAKSAVLPGGSEMRLVKIGTALASYWRGDQGLSYAVVEEAPGPDVGQVATKVAELMRSAADDRADAPRS